MQVLLDVIANKLSVEPVTVNIGAVVSGVDLREDLAPEVVTQISDALVQYKVLFFRDQNITRSQHIAFARRFGELEIHPLTEHKDGFKTQDIDPEIMVVESTADKPVTADTWHSDVTWRATPSLGSILRCLVSPKCGGDTLWADMEAAYEGLDKATKQQLEGMKAAHDWEPFRQSMRGKPGADKVIEELVAKYPPAEHPIVRTHPVSGRKALYVNAAFTTHIPGLDKDESKRLLRRLYRTASKPDYQVRFRWEPNSIAFWDNRSTQHYAVADFFPEHRLMERVTVAGDRPF
ncbi:MAG: taurine dioxygenase [Alphaproteobacteria bacterium]|nr:MAG: taurine dioxygenase [Alphaproteobacteria bacterium]